MRVILGGVILASGSAPAWAHEVGLSRGDYALRGATLTAEVIFARQELANLVAGLDADHDGVLTAAEVERGKDSIAGAIVGRIKVSAGGVACPGSLDAAALAEQDGVSLRATYRCPAGTRSAAVKLAWLEDVAFGHRHLARATGAAASDHVLSQRTPSFSFEGGPEAAVVLAPAPGESSFRRGLGEPGRAPETWIFLLGLLAAGAPRRASLAAAGAFAAALMAGLAIGALGIWTPSPPALAIAAALSVAYLGVDNLAPGERRARALVSLPFGIVHGLLAAVAVQGSRAALPGYALGVASALAVALAVGLPALGWVARRDRRAGPALSVAVAAAGFIGVALRLRG